MRTITIACDTLTYQGEDDPLSKDEPYLVVIGYRLRVVTDDRGRAGIAPGSLATSPVGRGPHNNIGRPGDNWARKGSTYGFDTITYSAELPIGEAGWVVGALVVLMEEDAWAGSTAAAFRDGVHRAVRQAVETLSMPSASSVAGTVVAKIVGDLTRALQRSDLGGIFRAVASAADPDEVGGANVVIVVTLPGDVVRMHAGPPPQDPAGLQLQPVGCSPEGSARFSLPYPTGNLTDLPGSARYQGRCTVGGRVTCRQERPPITALGKVRSGAVLFYDRGSGQGATAVVDGRGTYRFVEAVPGFSRNWTHITGSGTGGVLFYAQATGHGATAVVDRAGRYRFVEAVGGFSRDWTHVVGSGTGGVLFYAQGTGQGATAVVDAQGRYRFVEPVRGFSPTWTHIVGAGNGGVLFYERGSGQGATAVVDRAGRYRFVEAVPGFSPNWSHIVGVGGGRLLLYDEGTGKGATALLDAAGQYRFVAAIDGFSRDWTHIVGTGAGGVLFYARATGMGATAVVDSAAAYRFVEAVPGFSTTWTHLVRG